MCCCLSFFLGVMGGSPCLPEILRRLKTDMKMNDITVNHEVLNWWRLTSRCSARERMHVMFYQLLYGTTENSPVTFLGFPQDPDDLKFNTVGCVMHHTEVPLTFHPQLYLHISTTVWLTPVSLYHRPKWWTLLGTLSLWEPQASWWSEDTAWCLDTGRMLRKPVRRSPKLAGTGLGMYNFNRMFVKWRK